MNGPRWKGIVLAGGTGSRLHPMTLAVSKQLLPVYDKPLIYYPLSALMLAGIREILVITTPADRGPFQRLLSDGTQWGIDLHYADQPRPEGLAQAFLIAADFLAGNHAALVLGDNLFYGQGLRDMLGRATSRSVGGTIFGYPVRDPQRYGVVEFGDGGSVKSIEEKPARPRSNYAIPGMYFCDPQVVGFAERLEPSARGELEITDILQCYKQRNELHVERLSRGFAWLDAGTPDSLLQAAAFVQSVEQRQGFKIACLEEIAWMMRFIDLAKLQSLAETAGNTDYGAYLRRLAEEIEGGHYPPGSERGDANS